MPQKQHNETHKSQINVAFCQIQSGFLFVNLTHKKPRQRARRQAENTQIRS